MKNDTKLVNKSDIQKALKLRGPFGWLAADFLMRVAWLNKANRIYEKCKGGSTSDFSARVLKEFDIKYDLKPGQLDYIPREGPFVLIANHHFGCLDGLLMFDLIGHIRPDLHSVTTFLLGVVPEMRPAIFSVNPFNNGVAAGQSNLQGMRQALEHIHNGGSIALFPAGEVATYQPSGKRTALEGPVVEDIPWPASIVKFIRMCNCPVIPVYIEGSCSKRFHRLGKIHPMLRTLNLVRETINKKGRTVPMRIGKPISVTEMSNYKTLEDLYGYLRNRIYAMQAEFEPKPKAFSVKRPEPIAPPGNPEKMQQELDRIPSKMLFQVASYQCYLADYDDIPECILELGRSREEAFRAVGEGTDKSRDLDEFDSIYKHLILWDSNARKIAGAYRIGIGSEIHAKHGIAGFYSSSLLTFNQKAHAVLPRCAELGRTFVSLGYQRESLPLMLLFKGLTYAMMRFPEIDFFSGPVSISALYPKALQSLMVWFFTQHRHVATEYDIAAPRTPFEPRFRNVRPDQLLVRTDTVDKLDRLLKQISDNEFRLPTLVKKYFRWGANVVCFNVDPDFNNTLDGYILMPLTGFTEEDVSSMLKDETSWDVRESIYNRYGHTQKK